MEALHILGIKREGKDVYVEIWGSGEVYREFLYVDDLADACVYLMENVDAEEMSKLCPDYFVNIGIGVDMKIKDLAVMVKEIVGFKGEIRYDLTRHIKKAFRYKQDKTAWLGTKN